MVGGAGRRRSTTHPGTPTSPTTPANGSTAPSTVSETTTTPTSACQPPMSPARKPASCSALGGATYFAGVEAVTVIVDIEVWSAR